MISAREALDSLRAGNRRFAAGEPSRVIDSHFERRAESGKGQDPIAIILGCADSRVPVELVFDQGLGDLFVIRVAGNIAAPSQLGSIEYAAANLGTRLVVVLGHSRCGAVDATLAELQQPGAIRSPNLAAIVDRIRPAVEGLISSEPSDDHDARIDAAVRANVTNVAGCLRRDSEILAQLIRDDGLVVVGADYSFETGEVDFFDGLPDAAAPDVG